MVKKQEYSDDFIEWLEVEFDYYSDLTDRDKEDKARCRNITKGIRQLQKEKGWSKYRR